MKDETLAVLLFIAVFAVLAFGFSAVPFGTHEFLPTGFSIVNDSGNITVNVSDTVSIRLTDDSIDFGTCHLNQTRGYSFFDSSKENDSSNSCDNFMCVGIYNASKDFFNLTNDGNVNVNITVSSNQTAGEVYTNQGVSTNSYYQYLGDNAGQGCDWTTGNLPFNYVNMTIANHDYQLCDNMSYVDGSDSFEIYAGIWINATANNGSTVTWTFTATAI